MCTRDSERSARSCSQNESPHLCSLLCTYGCATATDVDRSENVSIGSSPTPESKGDPQTLRRDCMASRRNARVHIWGKAEIVHFTPLGPFALRPPSVSYRFTITGHSCSPSSCYLVMHHGSTACYHIDNADCSSCRAATKNSSKLNLGTALPFPSLSCLVSLQRRVYPPG